MKRSATVVVACWLGIGSVLADPMVSRGNIAEYPHPIKVAEVASGLDRPWSVAWLGEGEAVITERAGTLRLLENGKLKADRFKFPVDVVSGGDGGITRGQGGLLDVSASPQFAEDKTLFFTYAEGTPESNRTCVARATWTGSGLDAFKPIYCNPNFKPAGQHFGSRIAHLPDGTLLVSIGDGGNPPVSFEGDDIRKQAQHLNTAFGSVIRLHRDGTIPSDNPFLDTSGALPEIWSYGHRNIQGIFFDAKSGDVWSNEHGAAGGDEINRLEPGVNYGWPAATYSRNYGSGSLISNKITAPGLADPTVVWLDTVAPSGILMYRASAFADWQGALVSSGLVARGLRVVTLNSDKSAAQEWHVPLGSRTRHVSLSPAGGLHVITDDGRLLRLTPGS